MSPQSVIAHYRVTFKLGEGGMGEVWRATDTKLNREVAIKVLPESFAQDPDRLARFTREAQVLASLNHPNIAAIYGVEERALVMELVPGATLAERIAQGPIPVEEALGIGRQMAEALEYAHERGVIHRDLKPANIKLTPEGRVKVLDFGLAKAISSDGPGAADPMVSPTLTMRATTVGTIMGTAAYMAPEQARGHNVDRRADIWAFGVVLYEMLTGRQLFTGPTVTDTLASVLTREIAWQDVPAKVRKMLRACLERDPRQRLRDVGDAFRLLEEGTETAPPGARTARSWPWMGAAAVLTLALAAAGVLLWRVTRPVEFPLVRLNVDLGTESITAFDLTVAISPDGRRIVYPARGPTGTQMLATRLLDQSQPTLLGGTENGRVPFFDPEGQWIGFWAGPLLKKISVAGGAPVTVSASPDNIPPGAVWGNDATIVMSRGQLDNLWKVPAAGGPSQAVTKLGAGAVTHRWPQLLPGADAVLYTASASASSMDNASVEVTSFKTGKAKVVQRGGYSGRYLPSGHLVYLHQGVLYAVKFDVDRLETHGTPVPILDDVASNPVSGGGQFDFSSGPAGHGTFVYTAGKSSAQAWRIDWLDGSGKMQPLMAAAGQYAIPRLSPDGRKLAFVSNGADIYVYHIDRDTLTRLTFTGDANLPVWTPDGAHLVYTSASHLFWIRSDGAGDPQGLMDAKELPRGWTFSPDGRRLAYFEKSVETGYDLWTLPLDLSDPEHPKAGKPELFLGTPKDELVPMFSPDGRWIAYRTNEMGTNEIYVRPFPAAGGGKWQISNGGGIYAFWSKNGHELFYETTDNRIMVIDYTVEGGSFVPGKPRVWSDKQLFYSGTSNLDLAPDGKRFAVFSIPEAAAAEKGSVHVTFLLNFLDELKRRLP